MDKTIELVMRFPYQTGRELTAHVSHCGQDFIVGQGFIYTAFTSVIEGIIEHVEVHRTRHGVEKIILDLTNDEDDE